MSTQTTGKKQRIPRGFDSILSGAKSLPLKERVDLANALTVSINEEVKALKEAANVAELLVTNGK